MIKKNNTGKFWSFKDTKNYKNTKSIPDHKKNTARLFIFEKSYLLDVNISVYSGNKTSYRAYVIPLEYVSHNFPYGYYKATGPDQQLVTFSDVDIVRVL